MDVSNIGAAKDALGHREYRKADAKWVQKCIGFIDRTTQDSFGVEADTIAHWAERLGIQGVVWTNLPCKFKGTNHTMPSAEEVLAHLSGLIGEVREAAERYVRNAPIQIDTPYRRRIESELGWIPQPAKIA